MSSISKDKRCIKTAKGSDEEIMNEYNEKKYWGIETQINIYDCDLDLIKDKKVINLYLTELCKVIDMEMYGKPKIVRFGKGHLKGFSVMQLITTSSITGHFAEESCSAYINVFSCKGFKPQEATEFTRKFFKAQDAVCETKFRN